MKNMKDNWLKLSSDVIVRQSEIKALYKIQGPEHYTYSRVLLKDYKLLDIHLPVEMVISFLNNPAKYKYNLDNLRS